MSRSKQCLRGKKLNQHGKVFNSKGFEKVDLKYRRGDQLDHEANCGILDSLTEEMWIKLYEHKEKFVIVYTKEKPRSYYTLRKLLRDNYDYDIKVIGNVITFKPLDDETRKVMASKIEFEAIEN